MSEDDFGSVGKGLAGFLLNDVLKDEGFPFCSGFDAFDFVFPA